MQTQVSQDIISILAYSKEEAMRTGDYVITIDHLLLGILRHKDNEACYTLKELGINLDDLKEFLEKKLFRSHSLPYSEENKIVFSRNARNALNLSIIEAHIAQSEKIVPAHLLLAILASSESHGLAYIKERGLDHTAVKNHLKEHGRLQAKIVKETDASSNAPVSILKLMATPGKIVS